MNLLCRLGLHKKGAHLDYIYGTLPREHVSCGRCYRTLKFERPTEEREKELLEAGDIRDGDTRGCNPI